MVEFSRIRASGMTGGARLGRGASAAWPQCPLRWTGRNTKLAGRHPDRRLKLELPQAFTVSRDHLRGQPYP
jgi:hypothetical protein